MKTILKTPHAPAPIGPYNQAVLCGDTLFISGQVPINPQTGNLTGGGIEAETRQVMENLKAILQAANMTFENVVKTTIFLTDMHQFGAVNGVYGSYVSMETAPARETVAVVALPKFASVEISMIAMR